MVCLCGDVRALAELEHGFEDRGLVAPRTCHDEAVVIRCSERLGVELAEDVRGEPAHVLALQRTTGRDCTRVARRVAVALLDRGRRDDDVVDLLAQARSRAPP